MTTRNAFVSIFVFVCAIAIGVDPMAAGCAAMPGSPQEQQPAAQGSATRRIGVIKAIQGTTITLTPDSASDVTVIVQSTTRLVRVAPGETNLKNATPVQLQDLQVGDRILAAGMLSSDNQSIAASSVVVMKHSDMEARHQQDLQDWQKRGVGGLVSAVDAATGTVTISVTGFGGSKNVAVHTSKDTVIRRYAPDSVKFDDAKPSTLAEIHTGDQLRARGDRSADAAAFSAVEIVSGLFPDIIGTVSAVDPAASKVTVRDVMSKKTIVVNVTSESQLRRLPEEMARRYATRLRGVATGAAGATSSAAAGENSANVQTSHRVGSSGGVGPPDFQQMLSRVPAVTLTDLHKGDAVRILSTEGTTAGSGTVITLVSGIEPILRAAPNAGQAMMLAPWSLSAPADAGSQ